MKQHEKTPSYCKGCIYLHLGGIYGPWCCKKGDRAKKSIGHCKQHNFKVLL